MLFCGILVNSAVCENYVNQCADDYWVVIMTKGSFRDDEAIAADDVGALLHEARVKGGFSVIQISELTRITKAHITALETNDFESLPGIAYIPGFIRNYCKVVGLNPTPLIKAYKTTNNPVLDKPEYKFPVQALVPKMAGSMVAMFVVVAGLSGYIGWNFLQEDAARTQQIASLDDNELSRVERFDQTESVEPETVMLEPQTEQGKRADNIPPAILPADGDQKPATSSDAPLSIAQITASTANPDNVVPLQPEQAIPENLSFAPAQATPEKAPVTIGAESDIEVADTQNIQAIGAVEPVSSFDDKNRTISGTAAQALSRAPMSEIVISASATSWIEIAKANGEIVVSKLLRKGDQFVATADTDLFLSTGNAGGIRLAIGDQPAVQIGRVGEIIRDLALSRDGLSLLKNNTQF